MNSEPKNVRAAWIEIDSDALSKAIGTGPRGRTGEVTAKVAIREHGQVKVVLTIEAIGSYDQKTVLLKLYGSALEGIVEGGYITETFTQ